MNWKAVLWILATISCDICAMYFGYVSLWALGFFLTLILFLAAILIICSFWMLSFRQDLLRGAVEKHTEAQLVVECHNRGFVLFPNVQLHYVHGERKQIAVYPGKQEQRVGYVFSRKGRYPVGVRKIVIYEPFGIFCRRIRMQEQEILTVLPRPAILQSFIQEEPEKGFEAGAKKKKLVTDRSMVSDLREYEYGDTLNSINWKATAKRNQVIVNRYEDEFCPKIFVYVDGVFQTMPDVELGMALDDYACDLAVTQIKSALLADGLVTLLYGGQSNVLESGMVKAFEEFGVYLTPPQPAAPQDVNDLLLLENTLFQKDVFSRAVFYLKEITPDFVKIITQLENQHVKVEVHKVAWEEGVGCYVEQR